jgi:hypothetical protein
MFVGNRCTRPLVTSDPRRPLWGVNPANTSSRRNGPPRRNYGTVTAQRPSTASVGSGRATANPAGCVGAVSCGLSVDVRQCLQGELARGRVPRAAPWNGLCARAASSRVTVHRRLWGATGAVPSASHSNFQSLPARRRPIRSTCAPRPPAGCRRLGPKAPARPAHELSMQAFIGRSCASPSRPGPPPRPRPPGAGLLQSSLALLKSGE